MCEGEGVRNHQAASQQLLSRPYIDHHRKFDYLYCCTTTATVLYNTATLLPLRRLGQVVYPRQCPVCCLSPSPNNNDNATTEEFDAIVMFFTMIRQAASIFWCSSCVGRKGKAKTTQQNPTAPVLSCYKVLGAGVRAETGREKGPRAHGNQRPRPLFKGGCSAQLQQGSSVSTRLSCGLCDRWEGECSLPVDLFGDSPCMQEVIR